MDFRSLNYITGACAGSQTGGFPETLVNRVCTDSRSAQPGDLFFALAGDRFDGHDFLAEVVKKGVAAVVVEKAKAAGLTGGVIAVESPRQALGRLAARYRQDFDLPVIAVAGSNGKTTTKELIAAVLRQTLAVAWSEASFNNDIGVPLTLLKLDTTRQAAVLEIGTNHPGELAPLVRMAQPQFGVITSIGREHLEFFGDVAGVAQEEGWLAELLPAGGTLFINGDSTWTATIARRTAAKVVRIGLNENNDWRAKAVRLDAQGVVFQVETAKLGFAGEYQTRLLGRHQMVNALFAVAVGAELGLTAEAVRRGLAECQPAKMRLQLWNWNGVCVLDDAYNANADSVLAALQTLKELPCAGRRLAVLGDMAELGDQSQTAHEETGRKAAELGLDHLFAVGSMAGVMGAAARQAGLGLVSEFADVEDVADAVKQILQPGDVILVKASRAARLERLVAALRPADAAGKI